MRFNQREWIGSVRRGGPCARPPLRVRGPAGDHKGRPYEYRGRATPSLQLTHTTRQCYVHRGALFTAARRHRNCMKLSSRASFLAP